MRDHLGLRLAGATSRRASCRIDTDHRRDGLGSASWKSAARRAAETGTFEGSHNRFSAWLVAQDDHAGSAVPICAQWREQLPSFKLCRGRRCRGFTSRTPSAPRLSAVPHHKRQIGGRLPCRRSGRQSVAAGNSACVIAGRLDHSKRPNRSSPRSSISRKTVIDILRILPRARWHPCRLRSQLAMRMNGRTFFAFFGGASISTAVLPSGFVKRHTGRFDAFAGQQITPASAHSRSARKLCDGGYYVGHLRHAPSFSCHLSSFTWADSAVCHHQWPPVRVRSSAFFAAHIAQPVAAIPQGRN